LYSFFFYCYAAHRYLHSFPTRRSSDLLHSRNVDLPVPTFPRSAMDSPLNSRAMTAGASSSEPVLARIMVSVGGTNTELTIIRARDRKSTRLNSSHVAISYAVFCLKKKK